MKTFKQWLLSQDKRIGAVGDLARDFRDDCGVRKPNGEPLPRRITVDMFRAYLRKSKRLRWCGAGTVRGGCGIQVLPDVRTVDDGVLKVGSGNGMDPAVNQQ
jgi:hypothetical protein